MIQNSNIMQPVSQLNLKNNSPASRYRSMDQINDIDSGRVHSGRKMESVQQERCTIGLWSRADIEDKYLRLLEDYGVLKTHARQQETKITNLATKIKKITEDIKRKENYPSNMLLMKEDLDNYKLKSEMAENQNTILKGKIQLLQSQLLTEGKGQSAYDNVPSRINSGIAKRPGSASDARRRSNLRILKPSGESHTYTPMKNDSEIQAHNFQLSKVIEEMKEDAREKDRTIQNLLSKLKDDQYDPRDKKSKVDENIELIILNKAMNEKRKQLEEMRARYGDLEIKQKQLEKTNYELIDEIERIQGGGDSNYGRVPSMDTQGVLKRRIQELEAVVGDHKREVAVLKETNEKLTNSAFDAEREHEWREKERRYRAQVAQLEITQKRDVGEKGSVLDRLGKERDMVDNMEKEISKLQVEKYELEIKLKEKDDKLRLLNKQGDASSQDIEEAIILVQNKRGASQLQSTPDLQFLHKVDKENDKDLSRRHHDLEMNHAETIQELEKTRTLLQTQYKFTNNYKQEAEKLSDRLEELRRDYDERLSTYARLLDIRAARIHKLEAQMKDVAYGTQTPKIEEVDNEIPVDLALERGENLLEVHIGRVVLTPQAVEKIGDIEPSLFGTWDFFDFETQATGLIRGTSPEFDIKAEYLVKVDDFFLNYLYKNNFLFELHQAIGTEFVTLASCQMSCKEIMDRPAEKGRLVSTSNGLKLNCKARLVGTRPDLMEVNMGVLEYWVRLKHPMDQVIRQYREKLKAEGYLMANEKSIMESRLPTDRPSENMNELIIRVLRCNGVNSRQKDLQPSSYMCYKFYDYNEHVSITIASSNNPEFHDLKRFPVQMDQQLHQYLKSQAIKVYMIDDLDPESSTYLGIAQVPLLPLSNNKKISGSFELYDASNKRNGTIDLEIEWMYGYTFSDDVLDREPYFEKDEPVSMLPGEMEDLKNKTPSKEMKSPIKVNKTKPSVKVRKPKEAVKDEVKEAEDQHEIIEAPLSPHKSILKKKSKPSTPKKRLSETLKNEDIQNILKMEDSKGIIKEDSPRDVVHENIELTKSLPKEEIIKDRMASTLQRLDQQAANGDTRKKEKESPKKHVADDMKKPFKTPRSTKIENKSNNSFPEEKNNKTPTVDNDVVMVAKPSKKVSKTKNEGNPDEIMVEIVSVEIEENAEILQDNSVKLLFAAYRIPGIHSEETESSSLAKPSKTQKNKKMSFNFRKTFDVSFDRSYKVRQHIAVMLTEDSKKDIVFNLIKEPDENEDDDCEDIGVAKVDVRTILKNNKNLENVRVPIYSLAGDKKLMGHMEVTVNMLGVLKAIEKELKVD